MSTNFSSTPLSSRPPLRFIHASDLDLDLPLEQIGECSTVWEQRMRDVSRRAAVRLFDKTIDENVDFLILSGNVLNRSLAGPGTLLFLIAQFRRLQQAGIAVYWAGGPQDSPEDWPIAFPLPENVHYFPSNSIQEYFFHRGDSSMMGGSPGLPVAKILGMSRNHHHRRIRSTEFPIDPGGLFTIAVANGEIDPESLTTRRIDYWAMGGSKEPHIFHGNPRKKNADGTPLRMDTSLETAADIRTDSVDPQHLPPKPFTVHYPGSTVARKPENTGLYGATLVEIVWGEEITTTFFPTSPVRWVNDQITLDVNAEPAILAEELRRRLKNYRDNQNYDGESQTSEDLLIRWFVDILPGPLAFSLRRGNLAGELLSEVRNLFVDEPLTWSVSLEVLLPEKMPKAYYDQQTMLGDFLRSVQHFQEQEDEPLDLMPYIPDDWGENDLDGGKARKQQLLLAERVPIEAESRDGEAEKESNAPNRQTPRYRQTPDQVARRQQILQEAAFVGWELLGEHQQKPWTLDRRMAINIKSEEEPS